MTEKAMFDRELLQQDGQIGTRTISHDVCFYIPTTITLLEICSKPSLPVAMINCIVWFVYGAFKKERDVPYDC